MKISFVVWCGVVWCGVVWCGVVWCGVVWCGVVWCGVVTMMHTNSERNACDESRVTSQARILMEWAKGRMGAQCYIGAMPEPTCRALVLACNQVPQPVCRWAVVLRKPLPFDPMAVLVPAFSAVPRGEPVPLAGAATCRNCPTSAAIRLP